MFGATALDIAAEAVLLITSLWAVLGHRRSQPAPAAAGVLLALASGFGLAVLCGVAGLRGAHEFASTGAACGALPALAVAISSPGSAIARRWDAAGRFALLSGGVGLALTAGGVTLVTPAFAILSALAALVGAVRRPQPHRIAAALALTSAPAWIIARAECGPFVGALPAGVGLHVLLATALWVTVNLQADPIPPTQIAGGRVG